MTIEEIAKARADELYKDGDGYFDSWEDAFDNSLIEIIDECKSLMG